MRKQKTVNWFQGNVNGGVRPSGVEHYGLSVEDLLKMKSKPEMMAERQAKTLRSRDKDMCPIKRIEVWEMSETRKNELLSRYGLGSAAARQNFQRKVTGR